MSWNGNDAMCDGCRAPMAFTRGDVSFSAEGDGDWSHYHQACWQTGWYTGIEPKGEWPVETERRWTGTAPDDWEPTFDHIKGDRLWQAPEAEDPVNSPSHYRWLPNGIEVIEITETLNFCLGNAVKYILRADHKGKPEEDLAKAAWYIKRELDRRKRDNGNASGVV